VRKASHAERSGEQKRSPLRSARGLTHLRAATSAAARSWSPCGIASAAPHLEQRDLRRKRPPLRR
jgi:hypothetical protein